MTSEPKAYNLASFQTWAEQFPDSRIMRAGLGPPEYVVVVPVAHRMELHIRTPLTDEDGTSNIVPGKPPFPDSHAGCQLELLDTISNSSTPFSIPECARPTAPDRLFPWLDLAVQNSRRTAEALPRCSKCGAHTVPRAARDGTMFQGCSAFPACGRGRKLSRTYPLLPLNGNADHVPKPIFVSDQVLQPVDHVPAMLTPLVQEAQCFKTARFAYLDYAEKFSRFNRVQSTVLKQRLHKKDVNVVLGTQTSTGKTIVAELIAAPLLERGEKVIYVSPLRSLSQERWDDWTTGVLSQYRVVMLTGDTLVNMPERDRQLQAAAQADLVIMTSELLDSLSRKAKADRNRWLRDVRLVILDEVHIVAMENRGAAVEVGTMRFGTLCPQAKILGLSATLPNVKDFQSWFTALNGKPTRILNSRWRPTELSWHLLLTDDYATQEAAHSDPRIDVLYKALEAPSKEGEKWLVFVHAKALGRQLVAFLNEEGIESEFHNADLDRGTRLELERRFAQRKGGLRILISTSTLAWGRTLPARNVAIVGTKRGPAEVDILDILQMGGRAGRLGLDPRGDVHLIIQGGDAERKLWESRLERPRPVQSRLLSHDVLTFHLLAEIANRTITDLVTAKRWAERTLAVLQMDLNDKLLEDVFEQLRRWRMIRQGKNGYMVTPLGRVSVDYYFPPKNVVHWDAVGTRLHEKDLWANPYAIAWLFGGVPSAQTWISRSEEMRTFASKVADLFEGDREQYLSKTALNLWKYVSGDDADVALRGVLGDLPRVGQACQRINVIRGWKDAGRLTSATIRAEYGVPPQFVPLCRIPGVGRTRATRLFARGVRTVGEVSTRRSTVRQLLGPKAGNQVIKAATEMVRQEED